MFVLFSWLLNVPATCWCISGTGLLNVLATCLCISGTDLYSCKCCHTEIEVADQTCRYLTQSRYTDTEPSSPSADARTPDAWQGSHWSTTVEVPGMTGPRHFPAERAAIEPQVCRSGGGRPDHWAKEAVSAGQSGSSDGGVGGGDDGVGGGGGGVGGSGGGSGSR